MPVDRGDAEELVAAMAAEVAALYDGLVLDGADMPAAGPRELGPPHGTFLVGYDQTGRAACCGGVKRLPDGACEIKRMYVAPRARRRGVARQLLDALEQAARDLGYAVVRLDTGSRQPVARALYESAGYEPVGNFNANPVATYFGEKRL